MARTGLCFALALTLTALSCSNYYSGVVDASGYRNTKYPLAVPALPSGAVMPPDWQYDNLYGVAPDDLDAKVGDTWEVTYAFDRGKSDGQAKVHAYELRLEHRQNASVVWLQLVPLSRDERDRLPRVLAHRWVESTASSGLQIRSFPDHHIEIDTTRYAVRMLEEYAGRVAGSHAHAVDFELTSVDQVSVDARLRRERVRLIVARPAFLYFEPGRGKDAEHGFPVVLIAGYSSAPEDFDSGLPAFLDFAGRITISGQAGLNLSRVSGSAAPQAAPAPTQDQAPPPLPAELPPPLDTSGPSDGGQPEM